MDQRVSSAALAASPPITFARHLPPIYHPRCEELSAAAGERGGYLLVHGVGSGGGARMTAIALLKSLRPEVAGTAACLH